MVPEKDVESARSHEQTRQKKIKLIAYIVISIVFQCIVIAVFSRIVMKVRHPKFRVGNDLKIQTLTTNTEPSPSFNTTIVAPIRIKNANFGPFKYHDTIVDFAYGGVRIGQVTVPKSKVNFRSTKKVDVAVSLNSSTLPTNSNLGSDLRSGVLSLSSQGMMRGTVELMLIFKYTKLVDMDCTLKINVSEKTVRSVECK